jgi:hypothetical protein
LPWWSGEGNYVTANPVQKLPQSQRVALLRSQGLRLIQLKGVRAMRKKSRDFNEMPSF